jgi:hypothetical protein
LKILMGVLLALALATPAMAMKFDFHGDLNNRFLLYTDQAGFFGQSVLDDDNRNDSFGEIKYRLITNMSTDDGAVKGVFAIEVGALKFGAASGAGGAGRSQAGGYSGDGVNIETRWFYTDFQIPGVASKARIQMGLLPHTVNPFFWSETAMGVKLYTDNWFLAWVRPKSQAFPTGANQDWGDNKVDTINARYDLKIEPVKLGLFATYMTESTNATSVAWNPATQNEVKLFPDANFDLLAVGIDGGWSAKTGFGKAFVNWDFLYENGKMDDVGVAGNDLDIRGYLLHGDLGLNFGAATVTYTVYYASGDDNPTDDKAENFFHVDVDFFDSFIFQESLTDDNVFFEGVYFQDKGIFFNKLALDYQLDKKTKLGAAVLYLQTAEDVRWTAGTNSFSDKNLGWEIDAYASHKLYDNLELRLNLGYLVAGDAMDSLETIATRDGSADVNIFKSEARVRYMF